MTCGSLTDFLFPLEIDVFHPVVEQSAYGSVQKIWVLDRSIAANLSSGGSAMKEEIKPNMNLTQETIIAGRVKGDLRFSKRESKNSIVNVIVTNIRDKNCNQVYIESAGPRAGKSTIFEVATTEPFLGPFGEVEYYRVVLRRSENQAVDL